MDHPVFSVSAFKRAARYSDSLRFKGTFIQSPTEISQAADRALIEFASQRAVITVYVRGNACVDYAEYHDHLIYRSITRFIARRFRIRPLSRDRIVKGVIESLSDATPMYIIRRDIRKFYESIPTDSLKDRLVYDTTIPSAAREHLKCFFAQHCPGSIGIPRGIGLSAALSELYMESFDRAVKHLPGVYRYFRFADDILIFSYKPTELLEHALTRIVKEHGLTFNPIKSKTISIDVKFKKNMPPLPGQLEYLGYDFSFERTYGYANRMPRRIDVSIAAAKLNRLKSRLILSIKSFCRDGNFSLLHDRLRILTGNYRIPREAAEPNTPRRYVNAGIYYNYRYCGTYSNGMVATPGSGQRLKQLDGFYFSLVRGNGAPLAKALRAKATAGQLGRLRALSFHRGFTQRISVQLKSDRLREIKGVWRNV